MLGLDRRNRACKCYEFFIRESQLYTCASDIHCPAACTCFETRGNCGHITYTRKDVVLTGVSTQQAHMHRSCVHEDTYLHTYKCRIQEICGYTMRMAPRHHAYISCTVHTVQSWMRGRKHGPARPCRTRQEIHRSQ
jgi:hypothetical protein